MRTDVWTLGNAAERSEVRAKRGPFLSVFRVRRSRSAFGVRRSAFGVRCLALDNAAAERSEVGAKRGPSEARSKIENVTFRRIKPNVPRFGGIMM